MNKKNKKWWNCYHIFCKWFKSNSCYLFTVAMLKIRWNECVLYVVFIYVSASCTYYILLNWSNCKAVCQICNLTLKLRFLRQYLARSKFVPLDAYFITFSVVQVVSCVRLFLFHFVNVCLKNTLIINNELQLTFISAHCWTHRLVSFYQKLSVACFVFFIANCCTC